MTYATHLGVDAYLAGLPAWQREICQHLRDGEATRSEDDGHEAGTYGDQPRVANGPPQRAIEGTRGGHSRERRLFKEDTHVSRIRTYSQMSSRELSEERQGEKDDETRCSSANSSF